MAKTFSSSNVAAGIVQGVIPNDPSVSGVVAPVGTILPRRDAPELWQKFGAADTAWQLVGVAGSYAPGAFTIRTGAHRLMSNHLVLTSTQRVTLQGTARLTLKT